MGYKFDDLSVLVVEDTAPMQKLLVSVLKTMGIKNVTMASNGEVAFDKFRRGNHDIIISDWQMEKIDGIALTKLVRQHQHSPNRMVPLILMTGYSAWQRVSEARDKGVTEFLVKPFTANDLAKRIEHVIKKPRNFIETQDFFGPDRRRLKTTDYRGTFKRQSDQTKDKSKNTHDVFDIDFK